MNGTWMSGETCVNGCVCVGMCEKKHKLCMSNMAVMTDREKRREEKRE